MELAFGCPRFAEMQDDASRACLFVVFFHLVGKINTHGIFQDAECPHFGAKLPCRRPGTKYCVDLFFFQNTLELSPLKSFLLPLA
jgi:hypothetical protein